MGFRPTKGDEGPLADARGSAWDAHCKQSRDRKGALEVWTFNGADTTRHSLIVGIGNALRGEDAAGLLAARSLTNLDAEAIEIQDDILGLLDRWNGYETVILIDAVVSGAPPGTVHCWNVHQDKIPFDTFACSTHSFGVAEAIELGKILDRLPCNLWIVGIETGSKKMAMTLSSL